MHLTMEIIWSCLFFKQVSCSLFFTAKSILFNMHLIRKHWKKTNVSNLITWQNMCVIFWNKENYHHESYYDETYFILVHYAPNYKHLLPTKTLKISQINKHYNLDSTRARTGDVSQVLLILIFNCGDYFTIELKERMKW